MQCSCIDQHDGEAMPDFAIDAIITAAKQHQCNECRRDILPGEQYERVTGKWDDRFATYKTCLDCLSVRNALFCTYFFGEIWAGVHELIAESNGEVSQRAIAGMTAPARAKICDMIEAHWAEEEEDDEVHT